MKKRKFIMKVSFIINIIIFLMTVLASIIMFTGFKFMEGEYVLESTKIGMFKFFTVDSNMFMGIVALIFAIKEFNILKGEELDIDAKFYILKLMATVGVSLTFLTVFCYLGPIAEGGIPCMIKNSNLFFHLFIPVLSILNFTLFEKTDKLKFRDSFLGVIPVLIYALFYLINVLIHIENGYVHPLYDWYWFVQGSIWQIVFVLPLMLIVAFIISLILWRGNKKKIHFTF